MGHEDRRYLIRQGVIGGLIAGAIFAVVEMLGGVLFFGAPLLMPWQAFASTLLGQSAVAGGLTFGVFLVGFIAHFVYSAIYGAVWGAIASAISPKTRESYGAHSAAAMLYGLVIYLVNFQIIARILYPWFLGMSQVAQLVYHVFAFGLPLGLYLATKSRPETRLPVTRRATV